jgi:2-C-methyl-D-erythritol 2,4-cyclodiphosphate synthase
MSGRVGVGIDFHRFRAGRPLILGGVEIPHDRGLEGHSDADVLTHAIVDAILGAAALGDIGTHFPDDDPRWKDAASARFLRRAVELLDERGYSVVNVDATVVTEAPKLAPFIPEMRRRLAETMGVREEAVSVKATTAEAMGAIGRREGVACVAVAMVAARAGDSRRGPAEGARR